MALIAAVVTYKLIPKQIEYKEKVVTKVQERVRTLTKIVVKPDGTKETIIDERMSRDTHQVAERQSTPASNRWLITSTMTYNATSIDKPTYGIGVARSLILGLSGGLYANTNKDVGLLLTYSF